MLYLEGNSSKALDTKHTNVFVLYASTGPSHYFTKEQTQLDGRLHIKIGYAASFMNVFNIDKSGEDFHLICDPRVTLLFIIMPEEAK
ncbi:hypothetical protein GH733_007142 [Mirounga leonina]|nr:hypothetical protein GH733_007142 [Mirounga leonina]